MKLLDLYCCAGGAGMGYHRAGFTVTGVDIKHQPHYPFEFIQADALEYLAAHGHEYDAIHASPPCQRYSRLKYLVTHDYPDLVGPTRDLLVKIGKPYIIENVPGAPLINPSLLCGEMFGLRTYRHRMFETNFSLPFRLHRPHGLKTNNLFGKPTGRTFMVSVVGKARYAGAIADWREAMGVDWMNESEIAEAIPPAYTEWIGRQLMEVLGK